MFLSKLQTYMLFLKCMPDGGGESQMTVQKEWHLHHFVTITPNKSIISLLKANKQQSKNYFLRHPVEKEVGKCQKPELNFTMCIL